MKTPEEIARETFKDGMMRDTSIQDLMIRAIEAYREEVIRDMADYAHLDDWNVPCVYVKSYAKRLREEEA